MAKMFRPGRSWFFNQGRDMENMRIAYEAGIMPALYDAIFCYRLYMEPGSRPCPEWIWDGVTQVLEDRLRDGKTIGKGQTGNERAKYLTNMKHYYRWVAVRVARENGFKGRTAFEKASKMLKSQFPHASADTIEKSHKKVNAALNTDEGQKRFYLAPYRTAEAAGLNKITLSE